MDKRQFLASLGLVPVKERTKSTSSNSSSSSSESEDSSTASPLSTSSSTSTSDKSVNTKKILKKKKIPESLFYKIPFSTQIKNGCLFHEATIGITIEKRELDDQLLRRLNHSQQKQKLYEESNLAYTRISKFIGFNYDKYCNKSTFDSQESSRNVTRTVKRGAKNDKNLSRGARALKRLTQPCSVNIRRLECFDLSQFKLTKDTRECLNELKLELSRSNRAAQNKKAVGNRKQMARKKTNLPVKVLKRTTSILSSSATPRKAASTVVSISENQVSTKVTNPPARGSLTPQVEAKPQIESYNKLQSLLKENQNLINRLKGKQAIGASAERTPSIRSPLFAYDILKQKCKDFKVSLPTQQRPPIINMFPTTTTTTTTLSKPMTAVTKLAPRILSSSSSSAAQQHDNTPQTNNEPLVSCEASASSSSLSSECESIVSTTPSPQPQQNNSSSIAGFFSVYNSSKEAKGQDEDRVILNYAAYIEKCKQKKALNKLPSQAQDIEVVDLTHDEMSERLEAICSFPSTKF